MSFYCDVMVTDDVMCKKAFGFNFIVAITSWRYGLLSPISHMEASFEWQIQLKCNWINSSPEWQLCLSMSELNFLYLSVMRQCNTGGLIPRDCLSVTTVWPIYMAYCADFMPIKAYLHCVEVCKVDRKTSKPNLSETLIEGTDWLSVWENVKARDEH